MDRRDVRKNWKRSDVRNHFTKILALSHTDHSNRYDIFVHPNGEERFRSLSEVNRYLKRGKDGNSGWDMVYYKDLPLSHFTSRIARQQSLNYKNLVELEKDKREARNYAIAERRKNNDGFVVTDQTKKKKKKRGRPSNAADDEKNKKKKNKTKTKKKKKSTVDAARETRIMELRSWTNQFTPGMMVRGVRARSARISLSSFTYS